MVVFFFFIFFCSVNMMINNTGSLREEFCFEDVLFPPSPEQVGRVSYLFI